MRMRIKKKGMKFAKRIVEGERVRMMPMRRTSLGLLGIQERGSTLTSSGIRQRLGRLIPRHMKKTKREAEGVIFFEGSYLLDVPVREPEPRHPLYLVEGLDQAPALKLDGKVHPPPYQPRREAYVSC